MVLKNVCSNFDVRGNRSRIFFFRRNYIYLFTINLYLHLMRAEGASKAFVKITPYIYFYFQIYFKNLLFEKKEKPKREYLKVVFLC